MFSNIISWSTAAFGGAPFRFNKCTALTSTAGGAAGGAALARRAHHDRALCRYRVLQRPFEFPCDDGVHERRSGAFQPHPHLAARRVEGALRLSARPRVHDADAV